MVIQVKNKLFFGHCMLIFIAFTSLARINVRVTGYKGSLNTPLKLPTVTPLELPTITPLSIASITPLIPSPVTPLATPVTPLILTLIMPLIPTAVTSLIVTMVTPFVPLSPARALVLRNTN